MNNVKKQTSHIRNRVEFDKHSKSKNSMIIQFFEKHARQPDFTSASEVINNIIDAIVLKLKEDKVIHSVQYVGSSYEGLKVGRRLNNDDLEFDIMCLFKKGLVKKEEIPGIQTHIYIVPVDDDARKELSDFLELGYVSPKLISINFYKNLNKCINEQNELKYLKDISVLRHHGPAIQLDVYNLEDELDIVGLSISAEDSNDNAQMPDKIEGSSNFIDSSSNKVDTISMADSIRINNYKIAVDLIKCKNQSVENNLLDESFKKQSDIADIKIANDTNISKLQNTKFSANNVVNFGSANKLTVTNIRNKLLDKCNNSDFLIYNSDFITKKSKFFSLDLVPTFKIGSKDSKVEHYIAKPMKEDNTRKNIQYNLTWRRSFSVEEKKMLNNIDTYNGCRKKVLRVIKKIWLDEPALHKITSYHLKTVMMHLIEQKTCFYDWADKYMFERFLDFLYLLHQMLEDKNIPHFYLREANLLEICSCKNIFNIKNRCRKMINSDLLIQKILKK